MLRVRELTKPVKSLVAVGCAFILVSLYGCGGGGGGSDSVSSAASPLESNSLAFGQGVVPISNKPANRREAARFLTQATFGPTEAAITDLMAKGYEQWIEDQFTAPTLVSYRSYWTQRNTAIQAAKPGSGAHVTEINQAFWANAIAGQDQLRQRVALALSEIFVVTVQDGCVESNMVGAMAYLDMLGQKAFGSYEDLLKSVSLHPIMGCFLSHLRNQKEDLVTGRIPDENYAREVMQLFSIGLIQLNRDGTSKFDSNGAPLETYTPSDVSNMAKVFTGWGLDCPRYPSESCFLWGTDGGQGYADRWARPMRPYAQYHTTTAIQILGTTIPANTSAQSSLDTAIKLLADHPNVGPFIGKQLIQRLVTSNPSPAYIGRVSAAFAASRDLKTMIKAILLDPEARNFTAATTDPNFGKVREPLLRMTALLRTFSARSATFSASFTNGPSGMWLLWNTNDPGTGLGQALLQAPSVFNYFRPGYTPANSASSKKSLVAPELQILHETSVAGYVNYVRDGLWNGWGSCGASNNCQSVSNPNGVLPDVQLDFQFNDKSHLLTKNSADLLEDVNQRLMYGTMPDDLRAEILEAMNSIYYGSLTRQSAADAVATARRRAMIAILLTMASPEFQVQK